MTHKLEAYMARPLVLSNGSLHVGINSFGLVHDLYFPHVGLENHAAGQSLRHKIGVWIDNQLSWLDDGSWEVSFTSSPDALIGHTRAHHSELGILLEFDDFVDARTNAFLRNIHIVNQNEQPRSVRLFLHQAFVIADRRSHTDTGQYLPDSDGILHYNGRRAFVASAKINDEQFFDQHSIGLFGIEGREGTWRDAEDGELSGGNVEHGQVDSTIRCVLELDAHGSGRVQYWIAAGTSTREAVQLHDLISEQGLHAFMQQTHAWWTEWLQPGFAHLEKIPSSYHQEFIQSLMIIKSQIDNDGAVIATTDSSMLNYARDAYGYCWPRDGAYVVWPLIRLGYKKEPQAFFDFCVEAMHPAGYMMHKYYADGGLGPSWHPYAHDTGNAAPIQEDETALVLFVFAQFYHKHPSELLLDMYYENLIKPMANWMAGFIDPTTGLPKPSYDLWEETYLTTTYTTSVTIASLEAAAELAELKKDQDSAVAWRSVADDIRRAARNYLYDKDGGYLRKGILVRDGEIEYNNVIDAASFYGAFMYGLFDAHSDELSRSFQMLSDKLLADGSLLIPRYENDTYQRRDGKAPNPWFITSLWRAEYFLETNKRDDALAIIDKVTSLATSTGHFAEQIDPETQDELSVSPLTWSHAEYLALMLDLSVDT